jgi:O-antigen/teichoic acid export membrane protein
MKKFSEKFFPKSDFTKNVSVLVTGTAFSQAIPFLLLPVFQRWFYSPHDFGIFSLYISISSPFIAIASLKYEYAIVLSRDTRAVMNVFFLSLLLVFGITLLLIIAVVLVYTGLIDFENQEAVIPYLWTLPVVVFFAGLYEVFNYWNTREKNYKKIAGSKVYQSVASELVKAVGGLLKMGNWGLITGRIFGHIISVFYLGSSFFRNFKSDYPLVSRQEMRKQALHYIHFPAFTMPTVFVSTFSSTLFSVMIIKYYGSELLGIVSVSSQYVAVPLGIISGSFANVFYQKIATIDSKTHMLSLYKSLCIRLMLVSFLFMIIVFLVPAELIVFVLGQKWAGLVIYLKIFIVGLSFSFVSSSLSFIYTRLMKQRIMLLFGLFQLALTYCSIYLGYYLYGRPVETIWLYTIGQSLYYLVTIYAAVRFIKTSKLLS